MVKCIYKEEGCEWFGEQSKLKAHLKSCGHNAVSRLSHSASTTLRKIGCEFCKKILDHTLEREDLVGQRQELMGMASLKEEIAGLMGLKEEVAGLMGLKEEIADLKKQLATVQAELNLLSLNHTGTIMWRIGNYASMMQEAKQINRILYSQPFYSGQHGYKLRARVDLNGCSDGKGSHISVYIHLLRGEYDAQLLWPFTHSVTFTLIHPTIPSNNIVRSFTPEPTMDNFNRPTETCNAARGFSTFASHDVIEKGFYVKDDVMFIEVMVHQSKELKKKS